MPLAAIGITVDELPANRPGPMCPGLWSGVAGRQKKKHGKRFFLPTGMGRCKTGHERAGWLGKGLGSLLQPGPVSKARRGQGGVFWSATSGWLVANQSGPEASGSGRDGISRWEGQEKSNMRPGRQPSREPLLW
jgi:hypothetical protein